MSDALDSYLADWREADPVHALAWHFLRGDERRRFGVLGALQAEWLKVVREVREPQVALARLGWWREELQRAAGGEARHPLAQALAGDPVLRGIPVAGWLAAVDAASLQVDAAPAANLAAQRAACVPLAESLAGLDTWAWFGVAGGSPRASAVGVPTQLLAALRALPAEVEHGRSPLPMNLLARHGLTTPSLAGDGPARRAALRDYLGELRRALVDAGKMDGLLSPLAAATLHRDLVDLAAAVGSDEPLAALRAHRHGFGSLLATWRAARKWRRAGQPEHDDDR